MADAKRRQAKTQGVDDHWKELVRGPDGRLIEGTAPTAKAKDNSSLRRQENLDRLVMKKTAADKKWKR